VDELFIELTQERSEKDYFGKLRHHISSLMQKGHELIYESAKMASIHEIALRYANSNANVLIEGESGVGKEVIATLIHNNSKRRDKPFIKLNISSIPDNLFESELFGHKRGSFTGANGDKLGKFHLANGGTLFLDEIGDMPLSQQAKLLRAIENQEISPVGGTYAEKVNVRIICATNKILAHECTNGNFRSDLLYRLNIVSLNIPPLSERKNDIPLLIAYFLTEISKIEGSDKSITQDAIKYLCEMNYPGNVRELKNILYRCYLMADTIIDVPQIKKREQSPCSNDECDVFKMSLTLDELEKKYLEYLAGKYKSISEIAIVLKMDRSNLRKKLKNLGIDVASSKDD
jgi:DNA-binding NtrC family response regulator